MQILNTEVVHAIQAQLDSIAPSFGGVWIEDTPFQEAHNRCRQLDALRPELLHLKGAPSKENDRLQLPRQRAGIYACRITRRRAS